MNPPGNIPLHTPAELASLMDESRNITHFGDFAAGCSAMAEKVKKNGIVPAHALVEQSHAIQRLKQNSATYNEQAFWILHSLYAGALLEMYKVSRKTPADLALVQNVLAGIQAEQPVDLQQAWAELEWRYNQGAGLGSKDWILTFENVEWEEMTAEFSSRGYAWQCSWPCSQVHPSIASLESHIRETHGPGPSDAMVEALNLENCRTRILWPNGGTAISKMVAPVVEDLRDIALPSIG